MYLLIYIVGRWFTFTCLKKNILYFKNILWCNLPRYLDFHLSDYNFPKKFTISERRLQTHRLFILCKQLIECDKTRIVVNYEKKLELKIYKYWVLQSKQSI